MGGRAADGRSRAARGHCASEAGTSRETRVLDGLLLASVAAAAMQLVPLPPALLEAISPHADSIRSALYLGPPDAAAWQPISVSPASTAYASGS